MSLLRLRAYPNTVWEKGTATFFSATNLRSVPLAKLGQSPPVFGSTLIRGFLVAVLVSFSSLGSIRTALAADPPAKQPAAAASAETTRELNPRVLFITAKDDPKSNAELAHLRQPGGEFDKLRSTGWKVGEGPENHIQIVDRDKIPQLIEKLNVHDYPTVACIDHGEIVRSFRSGCTTPLDAWTFGFLFKGIDERPPGMVMEAARVASTGSYPLRGNHWSVEDDWNPTRETVIAHLHGPNHAWQLQAQWHIDDWSLEELRSLHDDLHERYDTGGSSNSGNSSQPSFLKPKGT